jgi:outer membrane receptor protein involved in Fe transport
MKSVRPVSHLKLRASYGVTGSTALSPYQSLSRLGSTKYIVSNATQEVGWYPTGIGNADLTWETTTQTDAGLDLGLFNNRLNLSFDFYYKLTDNLLASVPLPPSVGFSSTLDNLGKVSNKGLELSVNASVIDKQDLKWNVTANISGNRNKVKEISRGSDIESGTLDIPFYSATNIIRQGLPMGMFYGYQEAGLDANGLIKYRDNVVDGAINALDRVIIGNPYPDFIWSISSDLTWRNWDMNLFIDASQGNDLFWATAGTHLNSFARGHNQFTDIIGNYWTPENPDPKAKYPVLSNQTSVTVSDRFIEDGSYIRLRNVSLGYSLPVRRWGMEWCSRARFYVTAINYLTITKYPGVDPEQNTVGSDIQGGIDQGGYPSAKSILVGVNLSF